MATISKRSTSGGKTRWDVRIRRQGHPLITNAFSTKADAESWARAAERDLDLGQYKPKPKQTRTLAEAISEFNAKSRKIASQHDREQRLAWWSVQYGKTPLRGITAALLNEALQRLASDVVGRPKGRGHRSQQTVRHYAIALSKCLSWAVAREWIDANPMRRVELPPISGGRIRWLTNDQRDALYAACDQSGNPDLGLVVRIAVVSGARQSEILGLRWEWIDFDAQCAFLPKTKNGDPRVMPLAGLVDLIRQRVRPVKGGLVFPSPEDATKPRNIRQAWDVARKRAGLADWRFHDLRHDSATTMLRAGVDSRIVGAVLGHKSAQMMRRYAHVVPESVVEAARKGNALRGTA